MSRLKSKLNRSKNNMVKKVLLFFFITGILILLFLVYFVNTSCHKAYTSKAFSSDNAYAAQVVETSCGGLLGDLTSDVNINKVEKNAGDYINFVDNHNTVFILGGAKSSIQTSWINSRTLKITYTYCHGVYAHDTSWKDIKIVYDKQCTNPPPLPTDSKNLPSLEEYIHN